MSLSSRIPTTAATTLALVAPHGLKHFAYTSLVILETEHPECRAAVAAEIQRRRESLTALLSHTMATHNVRIASVRVTSAIATRQGAGWLIVTADDRTATYDSDGAAAVALVEST